MHELVPPLAFHGCLAFWSASLLHEETAFLIASELPSPAVSLGGGVLDIEGSEAAFLMALRAQWFSTCQPAAILSVVIVSPQIVFFVPKPRIPRWCLVSSSATGCSCFLFSSGSGGSQWSLTMLGLGFSGCFADVYFLILSMCAVASAGGPGGMISAPSGSRPMAPPPALRSWPLCRFSSGGRGCCQLCCGRNLPPCMSRSPKIAMTSSSL
mmetsp:Transcript_32971/g.87132  ORF Transcript_32971/g.87132 Transcript_32971/m.87132 type:complete len:211 (+) Transcript_32971:244-876(+)